MVDSLLDPNKGGVKSRRRSGPAGRLTRTILLGCVAVSFAIYWLTESYGADREAMFGYLKASLLFVGLFVAVGVVIGGSLTWLTGRWRANRSSARKSATGGSRSKR